MGNCLTMSQSQIKIELEKEETEIEVMIYSDPESESPHHQRNMSNHYVVNYPNHEKRKDSTIYTKTHHELCHIKDFPCFICGKTQKKNNISLETHHFYCEKAAENAIDWQVFGEFAKHTYNIQTGENIGQHFDWQEVAKNPDIFTDSPHNMIVLCKEHHISGSRGIHHVPFPDWILQKYPKDNFQFLLTPKPIPPTPPPPTPKSKLRN